LASTKTVSRHLALILFSISVCALLRPSIHITVHLKPIQMETQSTEDVFIDAMSEPRIKMVNRDMRKTLLHKLYFTVNSFRPCFFNAYFSVFLFHNQGEDSYFIHPNPATSSHCGETVISFIFLLRTSEKTILS